MMDFEFQRIGTLPLLEPDGCKCKDWEETMPKLNGPIILASIRAGHNTYDGKPMVFCPWCGTRLADSLGKVPVTTPVDPDYTPIAVGKPE